MNKEIYWLNKDSRKFLERGYLREGINPEQRMRQIAEHAQKILKKEGFADKFEDYLHRGWYSLSSPIWANFGSGRGLSISCNGCFVEDDMFEIKWKDLETGMLTKYGAGTSGYFGNLRPRGSIIRDGGSASGPVHYMELFDTTARIVSQSNVRRGSFAAYLPVEHPDIEEFLNIREEGHQIQDLSIGVTVTDKWMNDMIDGDKKKRKTWARIIQKRFESGYPYIFFTDTVNNNAPKVYKDKGLKVHASNLCVTGDTIIDILINDSEKYSIQIKDLEFYLKKYENVKIKSFDKNSNQEVYSSILDFAQTGESTEIIEIEDASGNILKCTPDHKIYTENRGYVEAKNLTEEDVLNISK